jgi:hypothetical protein
MPLLANSSITSVNNIGTAVIPLIGPNPGRDAINFHNPGSVDVIVFPTAVLNVVLPAVFTPSLSALGGGYRIYANGGDRTVSGNVACQAWQVVAISGTNNSLTITES